MKLNRNMLPEATRGSYEWGGSDHCLPIFKVADGEIESPDNACDSGYFSEAHYKCRIVSPVTLKYDELLNTTTSPETF